MVGFSETIDDTLTFSVLKDMLSWDGGQTPKKSLKLHRAHGIHKMQEFEEFTATKIDEFDPTVYDDDGTGVSWDGENVVSAGLENNSTYLHAAFTESITETLALGFFPLGNVWHIETQDNVIVESNGPIRVFDGFSLTVKDTFNPRGRSLDLESDGVHVYELAILSSNIKKLAGFTETEIDIIAAIAPI